MSSSWFVDGSRYTETLVLNGVKVHAFEKLGHYYYASVSDLGRPVRVFTPLDQRNRANDQDYGIFRAQAVDQAVFQVPAWCQGGDLSRASREFRVAADQCYGI